MQFCLELPLLRRGHCNCSCYPVASLASCVSVRLWELRVPWSFRRGLYEMFNSEIMLWVGEAVAGITYRCILLQLSSVCPLKQIHFSRYISITIFSTSEILCGIIWKYSLKLNLSRRWLQVEVVLCKLVLSVTLVFPRVFVCLGSDASGDCSDARCNGNCACESTSVGENVQNTKNLSLCPHVQSPWPPLLSWVMQSSQLGE